MSTAEPSDFVEAVLEKRGVEVENLHTLAGLTKSGLDRRALAIVLELIENGVHPESIAQVIQEIRQTASK